jgi:hypothetical protein
MAVKTTPKNAVIDDRGSNKMSDDMFQRTHEISSGDLRKMIDITRHKGAVLKDWSIYGQPKPDFLRGVIQAEPSVATQIIKDLMMLDGIRLRLDVFPLGTPRPDLIQIGFRTPGPGR